MTDSLITGSPVTLTASDVTVSNQVTADDFLEVGETWTYSYSYAITQADIDAGEVLNTASVTAKDPSDNSVTGRSDGDNDATKDSAKDDDTDKTNDPVVVTIEQTATIAVTKSTSSTDKTVAGSDSNWDAGDKITYQVAIKNTGNVSVDTIVLTDSLITGSPVTLTASDVTVSSEVKADDILNPGETWTYKYTYVVTQDDLDAGEVLNTASVTGKDPNDADVTAKSDGDNDPNTDSAKDSDTDPKNDPLVVTLDPAPSLEAWKLSALTGDADKSGKITTGDTVTYTITIKNTGNVTLSDVGIQSDTLSSGLDSPTTISGFGADDFTTTTSPAVLAPGETLDYVATYVVTADDAAAGILRNTATAKGVFDGTTYTDITHNQADTDGTDTNFQDSTITGIDFQAADDEKVDQDPTNPVTLSPLTNDGAGGLSDINLSSMKLIDPSTNQHVNEVVVDGEGTWTLDTATGDVTFTPEAGFSGTSVSLPYYVEDNEGNPQIAYMKILFIDPRGVMYDPDTLLPIEGVELVFADKNGTVLDASCFPEGQQPQTTGSNGRYRFDLATYCTDSDGEEFQILIKKAPADYLLEPPTQYKQTTTLNAGTPSTETYKVVPYDSVPTATETDIKFFMSFIIGTNTKQIVNNHIPLQKKSVLSESIKADLRNILRDDLLATMAQQSRQMSGYAADALKRLKDNTAGSCAAAINEQLAKEPLGFNVDSAVILPQSEKTLDAIAEILKQCDGGQFEVAGHTDYNAGDLYNLALSKARSTAVIAALKSRGVQTDGLTATGYGESRPVADNATIEGRRKNRRVEFIAAGIAQPDVQCNDQTKQDSNASASINGDGVKVNGNMSSEQRDCRGNGWNIWEGKGSYLRNTDGVAQLMAQFAYRNEVFLESDRVAGRFIGGYASHNSVTGKATGSIKGFGLNAGLYGAGRFDQELFFDYYAGAALGRHNFKLNFARTGGAITADGSYDYYALFAGAALSGTADFGATNLSPRAGFDLAWSPGGKAKYNAIRGSASFSDSLTTGKVYGARVYAEAIIDGLLAEDNASLSLTPRVFCDRTIGSAQNICGAGLAIDLTQTLDDESYYSLQFTGERTKSSESYGVSLEYGVPVHQGDITGKVNLTQDGTRSIDLLYSLGF